MSGEQMSLDSLLNWMQNALLFPQKTSGGETARIVESTTRLTGQQHLAIYQRSYYLRLLECMREQFPALCHAIGGQLFTDFAREYLQTYPSESCSLYDLGRRFSAYLEETRPDLEEAEENRESWINFMIDLARFERQLFEMFDAPGHEGRCLADESVPDRHLRLQPCFALGDYRFPVSWYYYEVRKGKDPPYPPQERSRVALLRKDYVTHTIPLTPPHYIFLESLGSGKNVEESLDLVARELEMPSEKVYQSWTAPDGIRKRWIRMGVFIAADSVDNCIYK
jgi:hypothetical protein